MLSYRPYCQPFHEGAVSYKSNPFGVGEITHVNNSSLIWVRKLQSPSGHVPNHYMTANYNESTWKYMMFWHMLTTAVVFLTLLVENWHKIGESFQKSSVYKEIHCQWSKMEFLMRYIYKPSSIKCWTYFSCCSSKKENCLQNIQSDWM